MTPSAAWKLFHPELEAVTVDNWCEADYEDDPDKRQLAADIDAGVITPGVVAEIENCLGRCWCKGRVHTAALTLLAAHGALEVFDPAAVYSRRPRTLVINGTRYLV